MKCSIIHILLLSICFTAFSQKSSEPKMKLKPDQDSFVRRGSYDTENFDLKKHIVIRQAPNPDYIREGVMIFDISSLKEKPKKAILNLSLVTFSEKEGASSATVKVYQANNTDWDESKIAASDIEGEGEAVASATILPDVKICQWDITSIIAAAYGKEDKVSILLRSESDIAVYLSFHSKESKNKPVLELY